MDSSKGTIERPDVVGGSGAGGSKAMDALREGAGLLSRCLCWKAMTVLKLYGLSNLCMACRCIVQHRGNYTIEDWLHFTETYSL